MPKLSNALSPVSRPIERALNVPILFSLIILYQGLFSGNAITIPERLKSMFQNRSVRFMSLMLRFVRDEGYRVRTRICVDFLDAHLRVEDSRRA